MITCGVDVGSRNVKVVIVDGSEVLAWTAGSGGFRQGDIASDLLGRALGEAGVSRTQVAHVTVSGAGRKGIGVGDSHVSITTAAARGAQFFFPGVTTVVEVGAEESRAIKTDGRGTVLDAAVNERCAAGSGSFTESMARALGMTLAEFAQQSTESTTKIPMNAQCTVFAESEVVSLIHSGTDRRDIARAVHDAIASRVSALVRRVKLEGEVVLLGGLAYNRGFVRCLAENLELGMFKIPARPEFADAVGAAVVAAERVPVAPGEGGHAGQG